MYGENEERRTGEERDLDVLLSRMTAENLPEIVSFGVSVGGEVEGRAQPAPLECATTRPAGD